MDQQPKIPTLKDAQKPQVKIKGMGAGLTLFDRLKQFKKKDLAFILAGLGTLFMAPLAEHFMMAPENGDASLQQGWGKGGAGGSFFGSGSSPYETGGMAPGGAIGGSGDIITPLNVRDPSSLVMGPGGTQQPPAGSAAPSAPPPTAPSRSDEDYKDALKGAASRAASAAVKKSPLPVPKVALGGSGLRGLGVASGGSSASGGSMPVGPAAGSVGGGGNSGLRLVRNTPGFKGVAGSRSPTGGTGLDNTKKAGANAGDAFNRAGSAAAGLNAAANETIPTAGQGFGGGGQGGAGANDKPGSGTGPGGSKSVGESLAFLRAKQRQEEELKLEFEKRKLKDPELLLYGIRNDILKASAGKIGEGLTTKFMCGVMGMGCPAGSGEYQCTGGGTYTSFDPACGTAPKEGAPVTSCWHNDGSGIMRFYPSGLAPGAVPSITCTPTGASGGATTPPPDRTAAPPPSGLASDGELATGAPTAGAGLDGGCSGLTALAQPPVAVNGAVPTFAAGEYEHYKGMKERSHQLGNARALLNGEGTAATCGARTPGTEDKTARALQREALQKLKTTAPALNGLIVRANDAAEDLKTHQTSVAAAATLVAKSREQINAAKTLLDNSGEFVSFPQNKTSESEKATKALTEGKAELVRQHGVIDGTQKSLEAVLKKTQETVGTSGPEIGPAESATLAMVIEQNQAFLDMKAAVERKKKEFAAAPGMDEAEKAKWNGATVGEPAAVTAGGGKTEPAEVTKVALTDEKSAAKTIAAVCDKIGGCGEAAAPAADASFPAASTDAPATTAGAAAQPPKYDDVSPLFQPAIDGVSTMRQVQSHAISGINADLTGLGAQ